jgi:hypothetical protein
MAMKTRYRWIVLLASALILLGPDLASAETSAPKSGGLLSLEGGPFYDSSGSELVGAVGGSLGYRSSIGLELNFSTIYVILSGFGLRYWVPLKGKLNPYAEVAVYVDLTAESEDDNSSYTTGVGLEYELGDFWSARLFTKLLLDDGKTDLYGGVGLTLRIGSAKN